jgi:hypothetical protein
MNASAVLPWVLAISLLAPHESAAGGRVPLYLFYMDGCVACAKEKAFLETLGERVPELDVRSFEARLDEENGRRLARAAGLFGVEISTVPATFIGASPPIVGYRSDATTGALIEERVRRCVDRGCDDPVAAAVAGDTGGAKIAVDREAPVDPDATSVDLPLVGTTDLSRLPLVALSIVLGGLDSFNPCAFFVLFTLLGILVHARSRRRMAFIGGTFVVFSGVVYFLFMAAWLNLFLHVGELRAVTTAAGLVALAIAAINVKDYFFFKRGVSLTIPDRSKPKLFERMRRLLQETSTPALVFGTVVLAAAANSYELLCTAGFPMVFTRILTLSHLSPAEHYLYLALYNVVYVVPLAGVVAVFSRALGARKLSEEQGRVMKLVSGLMMLGLGLIVLIDPSLFNNLLAGVGLLALALLAAAAIVAVDRARKAGAGSGHAGPLSGAVRPG